MTDRQLAERIKEHKNYEEKSKLIPHQKERKKKGLTVTVLQNGLPHQDIWAQGAVHLIFLTKLRCA